MPQLGFAPTGVHGEAPQDIPAFVIGGKTIPSQTTKPGADRVKALDAIFMHHRHDDAPVVKHLPRQCRIQAQSARGLFLATVPTRTTVRELRELHESHKLSFPLYKFTSASRWQTFTIDTAAARADYARLAACVASTQPVAPPPTAHARRRWRGRS